jgi:hypothetical protein
VLIILLSALAAEAVKIVGVVVAQVDSVQAQVFQ